MKSFKSIALAILTFVMLCSVYAITTKCVLAAEDKYDFIQSSTSREYSSPATYSLSKNGHDINVECTDQYNSKGDLYIDGQYADSGVSWNFYSDGRTVYYEKESAIYRMDIGTLKKEFILSDDTSFIQGIYNDKFLYYGSMKYSSVTDSLEDLIIYDLENKKEVTYIVDVGSFETGGNKIFVEPCSGDVCKLEIREFDVDGSNEKIIVNDASSMKAIGDILYYAAIEHNSYEGWKSKVKSYNINTGDFEDLTDYYAHTYVLDFTPTYAIFHDEKAWEEYAVYYKLNNDNITVILNGQELTFDQPPIIKDDRTLVPLRAIFEAMGAAVDWNGNTQTVTSTKGSTTISMTIGSNIMLKNSVEIYLDVPAQLVGDYTMVPVRAVAEAFGADVNWEESTRTIYIDINTKTHGIVIYADSKYNEIAAQLFTEILRNNQLGTNEQDVHCLYEPSEDEYNRILSTVRQNAKDEDITYFFYAGHGDDDGGIYPDYNNDSNVDTYMKTPTQLIADLQDIPGTIIVILESCHSGCIQNVENLDRNKFKIITSSSENQYSDTDHLGIVGYVKDKRLGNFSEALLNGLGGLEGTNIIYNTITGRDGTVKADYNNDHNVTISELFTYIDDNMNHEYWYQFNLFRQDPTCSDSNDQTVIYAY